MDHDIDESVAGLEPTKTKPRPTTKKTAKKQQEESAESTKPHVTVLIKRESLLGFRA